MEMAAPSVYSTVSPRDYSEDYMNRFQCLVLPTKVLAKKGYVMEALTVEAIEGKKKCKNCDKSMKKYLPFKVKDTSTPKSEKQLRQKHSLPDQLDIGAGGKCQRATEQGSQEGGHLTPRSSRPGVDSQAESSTKSTKAQSVAGTVPGTFTEPILRCKYHNGIRLHGSWSCCRKKYQEEGCCGVESHIAKKYPEGELESYWQSYPTPPAAGTLIRPVVAIDCEMGTTRSGNSELIRVTMIDYFTSEVLVNHLVWPDVPMLHYNTRYSGVTRLQMEQAKRDRQCLHGKQGARAAVWQFVGPATIVVGHSAHNDLSAMRWIHCCVVDTFLIDFLKAEKERRKEEVAQALLKTPALTEQREKQRRKSEEKQQAIEVSEKKTDDTASGPLTNLKSEASEPKKKIAKGSGAFSLKTMALVKLGRQIQMVGRAGHDSLEDAIASRDIAHWHVLNDNSYAFRQLVEHLDSDDDAYPGDTSLVRSTSAKAEEAKAPVLSVVRATGT